MQGESIVLQGKYGTFTFARATDPMDAACLADDKEGRSE